jgi:predicted kinase
MEAILFMGIQASGKSTFYRERFFDTHVRINLDMLRTRRRARLLVEACIAGGTAFVLDNTSVTAAERAAVIVPARAAGFRVVGYFFEPETRGVLERNAARERRVPAAGIFGTLKRMERPTIGEGFDVLHRVTLVPGGGFSVGEYGG